MKKLLVPVFLIFGFAITFAQSEKEKVESSIDQETIKGHIYFLADDLLKGRETGTPENKIAASYLANSLRSYGVKPNPKTGTFYQEVRLKKTSPPQNSKLSINGSPVMDMAILDAKELSYDGSAIYLNYGMETDYQGKDVSGKVVIMKAGSDTAKDARAAFRLRKEKQDLAVKAGAKAVIELLPAEAQMWDFIEHNFNTSSLEVDLEKAEAEKEMNNGVAHIWVKDTGGTMATQLSASKTLKTTLQLEAQTEEKVLSNNVIGVVEGTDPKLKNEYIIYSAHYDHVGIGTPDETGDTIYNGARDNAVGTTTVLSMAQNLAKYPTKRSALFILFTGEEKGLLGSKYYVENPVLPLNQMVYCFNSDNAGYNDTSLISIIGLPRTTAEQNIKDAATAFGLTAVDDPAPEQGLFDRSDNVHFAAKGIPAPTFSLGFTAFNGDVTKYYHRPGDEAETLDYEYLEKFFKAYVMAGRNIANDPATPTWTSGDKYEEAGKKLYNRIEKN